ncbi:MAG TPA: hypothetical protein VF944_10260 [Candidatus Bathyarchaeia archaeon]
MTKTYVGRREIIVPTAAYDTQIRELPDLVKIDVEGQNFLF